MAVQSYKLAMLKARRKYQRAVQHVDWFHDHTDDVMAGPGVNPDWEAFPGVSGTAYPHEFLFGCRGDEYFSECVESLANWGVFRQQKHCE